MDQRTPRYAARAPHQQLSSSITPLTSKTMEYQRRSLGPSQRWPRSLRGTHRICCFQSIRRSRLLHHFIQLFNRNFGLRLAPKTYRQFAPLIMCPASRDFLGAGTQAGCWPGNSHHQIILATALHVNRDFELNLSGFARDRGFSIHKKWETQCHMRII